MFIKVSDFCYFTRHSSKRGGTTYITSQRRTGKTPTEQGVVVVWLPFLNDDSHFPTSFLG